MSLFGGLYAWLIVFVTHLFFRYRRERMKASWSPMRLMPSALGITSVAAILLTTLWVDSMRITLIAGLSWLAVLSLAYILTERRHNVIRIAEPQ